MRYTIKSLLSTCLMMSFISLPVLAQTQPKQTVNSFLDDATKKITALNPTNTETLEQRIGRYIGVVLSLVASILVILIIYAGFLWFTAGGNADQIQKAKDILKNCIIGILIIVSAYLITQFVVSNVQLT